MYIGMEKGSVFDISKKIVLINNIFVIRLAEPLLTWEKSGVFN